ncbi:MAG: hypothetical protein EGP70_00820 [Butyricicoccus sp.]|nr:hypothetical protein [Butyricicoccus sp.]
MTANEINALVDRLREQGAELRQELSETALTRLTNLSYRVEEAAGELAERTRDAREEAQARTAAAAMRAADLREDIQNRLDELQRRFDERAARLSRTRKSLLRGNPTARSAQYDVVLQKLKKHLDSLEKH